MKKIILILSVSVFLSSCKSSKKNNEEDVIEIAMNSANSVLEEAEMYSDIARNLNQLSSDELMGRQIGTEGIEKAAQYLEAELTSIGVKPYFDTFRDVFEVKGVVASNIVGVIEGSDSKLKDEYVILGAHYDHIGSATAVDGDQIANGANDNASGCTAVLAMARSFAKANLKRSVLIVFFSAEESGLLGSIHLANKLKGRNLNLYAMYNFEMLGVPMKDKDYLVYHTGIATSNMAEKINEYAGKKLIGQLPEEMKYQLFRRSDNYSFYLEFKVPSHTVSTFDFQNYEYYHHVKDEFGFLDAGHIANVAEELRTPLVKVINSKPGEIHSNDK